MGSFFGRRVSRRIAVAVALAMGAAGLGGLSLLLEHTFNTKETAVRRLLETLGHTVAASFQSFDVRHERHPIDDLTAQLAMGGAVKRLEVFAADGTVRWSSAGGRVGQPIEAQVGALLRGGAGPSAWEAVSEEEIRVALPLRKTSACLPCHADSPDPIGGLYAATDTRELLGDVGAFARRASITVVGLVVLITALLLFLVHRVVVARIETLAGVMLKAEEGDYMVRAEVTALDEIGVLASTFNRMLAKITDLRVERIESEREMRSARQALELREALDEKTAAIELTNRRLAARVAQLSFLNQLGRDLSSKLDLAELLEQFAERITSDLGVPELAVMLLDERALQLQVARAEGFSGEREVVTAPFDLGAGGPTATAVQEKRTVYIPDLAVAAIELAYRGDVPATGALLSVPMVSRGRVIGALNFSSPKAYAFSEEEQLLYATVTQQAALALANAQLFEETLELTVTDGLTGIPNRRGMETRLELEWSRAQRDSASLSLILIDIDHFKIYNDQHGHQSGDDALRRVARLLARSTRKADGVARYGGEEFVVILPRASKKEAVEVARKLRRSVEQADFLRGYLQPLGRVTVSCGVATATEDAESIVGLIEAADRALLAAKRAGRNRVWAWGGGEMVEVDPEGSGSTEAVS